MKKIKVLEVNNIDLPGKIFNGYNFIGAYKDIDVKQMVCQKLSTNDNVIELFDSEDKRLLFLKYQELEKELSIHNIFSISTPCLLKSKEYSEADIIHFHMYHNTKLSLNSLKKISQEKNVIISLHDPWFLTGRCVHFYSCDKWQNGCIDCPNLKSLFPLKKDHCNKLWKIKENIFHEASIKAICPSQWMFNHIKKNPYLKDLDLDIIPFGVDTKVFNNQLNQADCRNELGIKNDSFVIFFRSQKEFKGLEYIIEALNKIDQTKNITIMTCGEVGLLENLYNKYQVIEMGNVKEETLVKLYRASNLFLMPSTAETFGMMAVESMACGIPIIVFKDTALEFVTDSPNCGISVKYKDSNELFTAIKNVINSKIDIQKNIDYGLHLVKEKYSLSVYYDQIRNLYLNSLNICKKVKMHQNYNYQNINSQLIKIINEFTKKTFKGNLQDILYLPTAIDKENIEYNEDELAFIDDYCLKVETLLTKRIIYVKGNLRYTLLRILKKNQSLYQYLKKMKNKFGGKK